MRKFQYASEGDAINARLAYYARMPEPFPLYTYRCSSCGLWHLTKMHPDVFNARKQAQHANRLRINGR